MIDLLDLVRSIAAAAERAAENKNYPVPCGQSSTLLDSVRKACVERGYTAGGLAVAGVTVEPAPAGTAVATPQPVIGRLMDQISALPVLRGLNEPGALLRNSDVLRVLVAAGREQAALAAAPQVAADDRALSLLSGIGRTIIGLRDGWGDKNDADEAIANIAEVKSALAAAPVQAQEPVDMLLYCPACGTQHIDAAEGTDWTNPPHRSHLCHSCKHVWRPADVPTNGVARVKTAGSKDSAPAQLVAVPDGWKLLPVRMTPEMKSILKEVAPKWSAESIYVNLLDAAPAAPAAQGDAKDAERLEFIESGTFDLRCYNDHDDDVYWNVIEHHMAAPIEREIGWGNTARQAIDAAITTKATS